MANNSNDPKPTPPGRKPGDKAKTPDPKLRPEDTEPPASVPFGQVEDAAANRGGLSDPELYLHDPNAPESIPASEFLPTVPPNATPDSGMFENLRLPPEPQEPVPPRVTPDSDLFVNLRSPGDTEGNSPRVTPQSAVFENLKSTGDSGIFEGLKPDSHPISSQFEGVPTAQPISDAGISKTHHDPDAAIGNLEPVNPVAPASGWLDSETTAPHSGTRPPADPLKVEQADLFEGPPVVESSDIFSSGAAAPAKLADGSDVIGGTAMGKTTPADPDKPDRLSDIALSFDQPPGGSTIDSGGSDLPVAEEVSASDPLFDSERFKNVPKADDSPEFGSTPELTQDSSSILADLSSPGDVTINDSSAIRLESPGIERTHSSHPSSGTEFDLTIGEGEIPPELSAAAEAAETGVPLPDWPRRPPSDPDQRTIPELDLDSGRVQPVNPRLRPDDPSSIFDSINDPVVFRRPGETERTADDDAAVEFTDQPDSGVSESPSSSSLFGPKTPPKRPRPTSEHDFDLHADPSGGGSGVLDYQGGDKPKDSGESSSILNRGDRPGRSRRSADTDPDAVTRPSSPLSSTPGPKQPATRPLRGPAKADTGASDSVEVDWVAGSSSEQPPVRTRPEEKEPPARKPRDKERPSRAPADGRKTSGMVGGALLGMVVATAGFAGMYFSGAIPNHPKPTTQAQTKQDPNANPQGGGNPGGNNPGTQEPAATVPGQARLFAKIQELGKVNATVAATDDADVKKAREELEAAAKEGDAAKTAKGERQAVEATIYLGVSHEIANERDQARKVYEAAIKKFPKYAATFQSAIDRLDATDAKTSGTSRRLTPREAELILFAIVLLQDDPAAKTDPEAGVFFWKAVKAGNEGKYADAVQQIAQAKAAHVKQTKANPGRGVNPLSDPLEQMFPRCCDDLKAYWELRGAIYSNKAVADLMKKDGPDKALAELAKRADAAVKLMTDLKDANAKLTKSQTDFTEAKTKLTKAETDLKIASDKVLIAEKDFKTTKDLATKFEKDYKTAEAARVEASKKLAEEANARTSAETERKKGDDLIASLAKELQAVKLLPEKYDSATLLAAQKSAASRATGPTLNALLPSGVMAIGGGGLTAGQLTDIAERLVKAEASAKAADLRLTTETKKLKDEHVVEVKKLTDGYTAETKKLMDTYATSTTKLKDEHAAEVKKMADKFVADMKKLTDTYDAKVKTLETSVAEEKNRVEALTAKFKVDLGAAMSPAQALDVWLPLLTDLRRASDAEPALATATKVIATSPGDSEDSAKARTVAGLAHFLKGDMTKAKEMFVSAKASPAYKAAAGKPWATAADVGLQAINDPLAQLRRPVEVLKRDSKAAARFLDSGVKAYKAGRFADAVAALADSVKADATDPVAWYFLGAAKWETIGAEQAKKEFEQGAEQEKRSPLPSRMIGESLSPIQGAARDALTAARP